MSTPRYITHDEWLLGMPGTDPDGRPYADWRPQSNATPLRRTGTNHVLGTAIHYPGSGVGSATFASALRDPLGYVRSVHRGHRNRKPSGFDIGYGFVVVPNGDIYEGRNWYRQAAHGGDSDPGDENMQYLAIQIPVDTVRPHPDPSPQQVTSTRWLIAEQRRRFPGANEISDHRTVDGPGNTSCPGEVLHRMVVEGVFEPSAGGGEDVPPPPPPPLLGRQRPMMILKDELGNLFAFDGKEVWWLRPGEYVNHAAELAIASGFPDVRDVTSVEIRSGHWGTYVGNGDPPKYPGD